MNKRTLGSQWEQYAVEYLEHNGYIILEKNYRCRLGEIDIIALKQDDVGSVLSFVEVKYRSSDKYGTAIEAVGIRKQQTIRKVAQVFLLSHKVYQQCICSFDIIAIDCGDLQHIKNAF